MIVRVAEASFDRVKLAATLPSFGSARRIQTSFAIVVSSSSRVPELFPGAQSEHGLHAASVKSADGGRG
jgi:hypothetical protein